jgi:ABC-type lipoprotein export system ATPase subunit
MWGIGWVNSSERAVEVEGLFHTYLTREGPLPVLQDVNLAVERGEYVSLMGASGSGKSTLLAVLGGLEKPQSGRAFVAGTDLHALTRDELATYRRKTVGFVFQHFGLLGALTAQENVELALTFSGVPAGARHRKAKELLGDVGLAARVSHRPHELSGGERQRVAIARAVANGPDLILADEPTGNLDIDAADSVARLLASLRHERGCTLLVVTHNPAMAAHADTHYALAAGRLALTTVDDAGGRSDHGVA